MKKEIIIRISVKTDKCQKKAMKVAATVSGVQSVTLAGGDKNLLLVIGDGVDTNKLTKKLKKKVGSGEIVELRTVDTFEAAATVFPGGMIMPAAGSKDAARAMAAAAARASPYQYHYQPSPYHHQQQQQWQQYAMAPSPYAYPYQYYPSPMAMAAGAGYGGSSYSRAVALSHPANYSPLVEKHDYHPMDHSSSATKKKTSTTSTTSTNTGTGTGTGAGAGGASNSFKAVPRSRRHESDSNGCCIL